MNVRLAMTVTGCLAAAVHSPAAGQTCTPDWSTPFSFTGLPTSGSVVYDAVAFDDGSGSKLYLAGVLQPNYPGWNAAGVIEFDGANFTPVSEAGLASPIYAVEVFDGGSGPALHRAGDYPWGVARWDGSTWTTLSMTESAVDILTMHVFDDGSGPALYAGGNFTQIDTGVPASGIARWDGSSWSILGSGITGTVRTMTTFDDGSGPKLVVGGAFQSIGGAVGKLGIWDGTRWTTGPGGLNDAVRAIASWPGMGSNGGDLLVVGGDFTTASGLPVNYVATWDGTQWGALDAGLGSRIDRVGVHDFGSGPELLVSGFFPVGTSRWNGSTWERLDSVDTQRARAFVEFDFGDGPELALPGDLSQGVAHWDGVALDFQPEVTNGDLELAEVLDDGSGPKLYVTGSFTVIEGTAANQTACWDGSQWCGLPNPHPGLYIGSMDDFEVYDDGNGARVYLATSRGVVRLDPAGPQGPAKWTEVSEFGAVTDLHASDDGSLYACGDFQWPTGGGSTSNVSRYGGSSWQPLGLGVPGQAVFKLIEHDFGKGPELLVSAYDTLLKPGGVFSWDGSTWNQVGNNLIFVYDVAVFNGQLYAGRSVQGDGLYRFNGLVWESVPGVPSPRLTQLLVVDDGAGDGPVLLASDHVSAATYRYDGSTFTDITELGHTPTTDLEPGLGFLGPNAKAMLVGQDGVFDLWGSACDPPLVYCTAKPSSAGCSASIGTSDATTQPQSGANDYSVVVTDVQGLKNGLLFVGIHGQAALPFVGGTLCVEPPTKRGPVLNSGGSGPASCDGVYSTIVNDGQVVPFGLDAGPGGTAWYQLWYRDPQNGAGQLGTALSNAVELDFE